jgi:tryptophan 2,3-dioxygenase
MTSITELSVTDRACLPDGLARPPLDLPGVGGPSLYATSTNPRAAATVAGRAVAGWLRACHAGHDNAPFPCDDVLAHFRAVGRLAADPGLVGQLRAAVQLLARRSAGPHDRLLCHWLPSTIDQDDGTYDSFLGARLLNQVRGAAVGESADCAGDQLLVALIVDLAEYEAAALAAIPCASPAQSRRVAATGQLTQHAAGLAPGASAGQIAADVSRAVYLSLLPLTPLHDEVMFLRVVQIFEIVYQQTATRIIDAAAALTQGDTGRAQARIEDATKRLANTPAVYRVLTSMPPDAFAVIRANSRGRSAIQSPGYRLVQAASSPRAGSPGPQTGAMSPRGWDQPTLQEAYLNWSRSAQRASAAALERHLTSLDAAWRALKRTHWGITRKIIGDSPGTGGTSGIGYLEAAAKVRLFPAIATASQDRETGR